jgi:hypothetical protein
MSNKDNRSVVTGNEVASMGNFFNGDLNAVSDF